MATPLAAQGAGETPQAATQSDRLDLARQIVETGYPDAAREQLFFGTMDQIAAQMREATVSQLPPDAGAQRILDEWLADWSAQGKAVLRRHIPALMEGLARSYANIFTVEELQDILTFVRTPTGPRFLLGSGAAIADPAFAQANQAYMNEFMANLPAAQEELRGRAEAHFAQKRKSASPD